MARNMTPKVTLAASRGYQALATGASFTAIPCFPLMLGRQFYE